jgi:dienelactone hydrolase
MAGQWAGAYQISGQRVSMALNIGGQSPPRITADLFAKGDSGVALKDVALGGGKFTGVMPFKSGPIDLDGDYSANEIVGKATAGGVAGDFRLLRLAPLPSAQALKAYEGLYVGRRGTYLIERLWLGSTWSLTMTEAKSSELRQLYPVGAHQFASGPRLFGPAPIESQLDFGDAPTPMTLSVRRGGQLDVARRAPLKIEDIAVPNGDVKLAGTLIEPTTPGRHPAIVFLHGSGANPRQAYFGLGYWLAEHGFAVVKFDKRGAGESGGKWNGFPIYQTLGQDAAVLARWLQTRPDVDPRRIGFWGLSEGAWTAPLAAAQFPDAAFVIMASGGGLSPAETELLDSEDQLRTDGRFSAEQIREAVNFQALRDHYDQTGEGWDAYIEARKRAVTQAWYNYPGTDLFGPSLATSAMWKLKAASYFYDPRPTLSSLRQPVLSLFGALDTPAGVEQNVQSIRRAVGGSGKARLTVKIFRGANHDLLEAATGNGAELDRVTRFSPEFFPFVTGWLASNDRPVARRGKPVGGN